ncbi:hypothetical protein B7494_g3339 [Chlorociboria aeruginascens]|nr:hypothetical protein B7494_g3339 [Chlorociboria aeruginascens]
MPPTNQQDLTDPTTPPQSIPLRDLSRPPDSAGQTRSPPRRHNRRISLLNSASRPTGTSGHGARYERLGEEPSLSPHDRPTLRPMIVPHSRVMEENGTPISPVGNPADFQAAMGFAGLHVPDINISHVPAMTSISPEPVDYGEPSPYTRSYGESTDDTNGYFVSDSDRIPLTDPAHLQPVSGAQYSNEGQRHDRSSFQSVRFNSSESRFTGARLGDDLPNTEAGFHVDGARSRVGTYGDRRRSRSPSTAGAFSRAGSIVRAMSQRVVNLSGEAELIEASARRESEMPPVPPIPPQRPVNLINDDTSYHRERPPLPVEKQPQVYIPRPQVGQWRRAETQSSSNPLKGKSMGVFSPENKLRQKLCDLLVYPVTEPAILALIMIQTILLAVDSSRSVYSHPRSPKWGHSWIDFMLLVLFVIFTLEIIARIIVSGFILNAPEYSTIDRARGLKGAVADKYRTIFAPQRQTSIRDGKAPSDPFNAPTILSSLAAIQGQAMTQTVEQAQRLQLARRAFLRHSFNRLDFLAVVSFWTAFLLSITGVENDFHLYIFRMLSCLRILRLLAITNGTAIILRSLKKAAPLLVNVSFLIGFFWLLFAIIGVQSFKSSFDRQCVWIDPEDPFNQTGTAWVNSFQYCGGQFNIDTGAHDPWVIGSLDNFSAGATSAKGYLCPRGSYCLQLPRNLLPYMGTISFDNIAQSLELVFVIMSANTFTDLMYYTMDSDYLAAALFFAGGIIIMMLWLMNLLIAVITSSFQIIREEGKTSAFAANKDSEEEPEPEPELKRRFTGIKRLYFQTYWFWIAVITYDLVCQACRSAGMSSSRANFIDISEIVVTFILLIDIVFRFAVDWRRFYQDKRNWFDLTLAIITTIILLPPIRNSGQPYAWLTVFQILRIYRVVLAVPITRSLITLVLGNAMGIGNLMLFVFLITFLISIFAVQLFRGELPTENAQGSIETTFFTIYNTFLGMYQVMSSENWTTLLYNITTYDNARNTAWIGAIFFIGWFTLSNLILVNMFIAVIQENFDVSEDAKRMQQVKAFLNRKELGSSSSNLSLSAIFRFGRSRTKKDPLDYGPATMEMLLKDAVVKDFLDDDEVEEQLPKTSGPAHTTNREEPVINPGLLSTIWGVFVRQIWNREPNPFYSNIQFTKAGDEATDARAMAKEAVSATSQRKKAQREFLARHPTYNNSLFIFKPSNPIRRACQRIVGPGRGTERIDGVEPHRIVWYLFSAFIYACIVTMVLLACVTTPLYQKEYFDTYNFSVRNWFVWTDMAFAVVFTLEALIKVIADGFFWTPNAYFRSTWGFIDGLVLVTLWINVITALANDGAISRAVGAFKALRALRLLNVSDSARDTFHSVIVVGGWKVISAAFVSLSLLIPFAIYGLNLFNGQMLSCNDTSGMVANLSDCFGEWNSTPFNNDWPLLAPRVVSNSYFSFDNFADSLFILFQIVSQEGWIDVMWAAESITGRGLQPNDYASQGNAIFFVIFNLLATVFILTLFISVFMRNYTEQTGVAYLTSDQRSWLELRKLLRQVSPSKRPSNNDGQPWKDWCYKRATRKHGKWHLSITITLVFHLILLLLEYYPEPDWWDLTRTYIFLAFTMFYVTNIVVRIIGLSWARFRRSSWDLFSIFAVSGTFITTVLFLTNSDSQVYIQLHKLFLVSIVLLLIPRNDALDQLFKTAAASLTSIANLMATWLILFLVFAIAMTQTFGLTRFGSNETDNLNFRTVPKALILLFRMSCGEGWNQIMEDYATITPPLCVFGDSFFDSDCGSVQWARALFILWNILSMYIFVSLFVSLIYESFSYVYQRSSGLGKVSREEIRRFKQAWATLDPEGTGFISKEIFPRLLGELSGVFEMRIYTHEDSIRRILEDVQSQPTSGRINSISTASAASGVDLKALNARVAKIDRRAVRDSRARYNLFFEEIMVSADPDRGISFTTVLMILAHYNVISDNKSLRLEEFLRRRARLQRVEEEVRRRIVVGFFDTMYWSRIFRRHMDSKRSGRMTAVPQLGPEVYIDDEEHTARRPQPPRSGDTFLSPSTADARGSFISYGLDGTPLGPRRGSDGGVGPGSASSPGSSPKASPKLSPHRPTNSAFSFEVPDASGDGGSGQSSRRGSAAENVLDVLDNSAWGEMMAIGSRGLYYHHTRPSISRPSGPRSGCRRVAHVRHRPLLKRGSLILVFTASLVFISSPSSSPSPSPSSFFFAL